MNKVLVCIFSICIGILSCKKNTEQEVKPKPEIELATYFQNTNEVWYFHELASEGTDEEVNIYRTFKRDRDTVIVYLGDTFLGAIITEESKQYGPKKWGTDSIISRGEYPFFYDVDLRLLSRFNSPNRYNVDYKLLDYYYDNKIACQTSVLLNREIEKHGDKYYKVYTNSKDQKIIEGITMKLVSCSLFPISEAFFPNYGAILIYTRYSSDEFIYEWSKE